LNRSTPTAIYTPSLHDALPILTALLPELQASIPSDIDIAVAVDRSTTIRASLHDIERTLVVATCLVIMVVFLFLRNGRAALIPRDRKSTRLNSSHDQISYAVFC